jgi:hypothetical protein
MRPVATSLPLGGLLLAVAASSGSAAALGGALARLRFRPAGGDERFNDESRELDLERSIDEKWRTKVFFDRYPITRFDRDFHWEQAKDVDIDRASLKLPLFLDRFDWIASDKHIVHQKGENADPTLVYCNDSIGSVRFLLGSMDRSKYSRADKKRRVLVIGGGAAWMSESIVRIPDNPYWWPPSAVPRDDWPQVYSAVESYHQQRELPSSKTRLGKEYERLTRWFQVIFVENKDVDFPNVRTLPAGFNEARLSHGNAARASRVIDAAVPATKEPNVLFVPERWNEVSECGGGWGEPQLWREQLTNWTKTEAALTAGVVTVDVKPQQWWEKVAGYRFLLAPASCDVQSPAIVEALLVLTVPIVRRGPYAAYEDLVRYGFPIVVVHELREIQGDMLENKWQELSPRLEAFRSKCLTSEAYWRLITGVFNDHDECWPSLD